MFSILRTFLRLINPLVVHFKINYKKKKIFYILLHKKKVIVLLLLLSETFLQKYCNLDKEITIKTNIT